MSVDMPDTPSPALPQGMLLGFDFGLRRIGVATGQTATDTASPLTVVRHHDEPDWPAIEALFKEWRPRAVVVGLPLDADGQDTDMSRRARAFGSELERRFSCPVHFCDERLTSRAAQERFAHLRASGAARRRDAGKLDAVAATIILQNWLQSRPGQLGGPMAGEDHKA